MKIRRRTSKLRRRAHPTLRSPKPLTSEQREQIKRAIELWQQVEVRIEAPPELTISEMIEQTVCEVLSRALQRAWQKYSPVNLEITRTIVTLGEAPGLLPEERQTLQQVAAVSGLYGLYHIWEGINRTLAESSHRPR